MPREKKHIGLLGWVARVLMAASAVLLLLSYLSEFVNPAKAWYMAVLGLLYVPLALLNLFLLCWAVARWSRAVLIPLIALLPSFFFFGRYVQFRAPDPEPGPAVSMVSYNVGRFAAASRRLGLKDPAVCADSVVSFLRKADADVICLQEFYMRDMSRVRGYLQRSFPGYDVEYFLYPTDNGCYGNVILSRLPCSGKGKIDFDGSSNLAVWGDYSVGGKRIRIYNCHLESYNISLTRAAKSLAGNYKEAVRNTEEKMRASILRRPAQVDRLMSDMEACPLACIVAGDFNDNPLSYTYRRLCSGRLDTFVEAGKGFGATYRGLWPLLRIDYILHPEEYPARKHEILRKRYSDHFPVRTELKLP